MDNTWRLVVFADECDEWGNCPICEIDYADCDCPGPTQEDEYEYQTVGDCLYARPLNGGDDGIS
ncbi:hypothetical protein [Ferrimonas balearica]|uniref:hypothetical protein n=1 Tax=Ferrimonas balearica TaxID=44012 RepID=UPI001F157C10|nr:hypothetical protein [Ferrimonas balearica]MBY6093837.1 hypothetical protein [Ferrimonas balearica]